MNTTHQKQKTRDQKPSSSSPSSSSPSPSSSPSKEFTFTVSLHPSSSSSKLVPSNDRTKHQSPLTLDLSPADDIFFHGHLIPLSLLSHLPVSPRSSTNSTDGFVLPHFKDLLPPQETPKSNNNNTNDRKNHIAAENSQRLNQKPFSLFNLSKWRKGFAASYPKRVKKRLRLDLSRVLKRYARMAKPVITLFRRNEKGERVIRNEAYCSYSGNLSSSRRNYEKILRGFSAPVSTKTSPSNSGLLVATTSLSSNPSQSTMEELRAEIQAAIAHCKNSYAVEEGLK